MSRDNYPNLIYPIYPNKNKFGANLIPVVHFTVFFLIGSKSYSTRVATIKRLIKRAFFNKTHLTDKISSSRS